MCLTDKAVPEVLLLFQNNEHYRKKYGRRTKSAVIDIGPKGRIEEGEDAIAAARREVRQETGLSLDLDTGFKAFKNYEFYEPGGKGRRSMFKKTVIYFVALLKREDAGKIKLSEEHERYEILPIDKAIARVRHSNDKQILRQCERYLSETARQKGSRTPIQSR